MDKIETLPHLISQVLNAYSNPKAFNYLENKKWVSISTEQFSLDIRRLSAGLHAIGVKKGDGIGIISDSSPFWTMMDLAIIISGGITVPMFANVSNEHMNFQIKDANLKYLFIASQEKWEALGDNRSKFKKVFTYSIRHDGKVALHLDQIKALGEKELEKNPNLFATLRDDVKPDDLATIIYTSGSTGQPKGVELTHTNLCSQIEGCRIRFDIQANKDKILSCLPLAHIFERMVSYFFISTGTTIYYADDIKNVGNIMREIQPTVITLVPRLLEKVFSKMKDGIESATGIKKFLGNLALKRAIEKTPGTADTFTDKIYKKMVYKKFLAAMGGKFQLMVCGGAALSDDIYRFFLNIGAPLYQGYGLTEASPVIAANYKGNNKIGTVGKAFPGVEVKINEDGEILAKGLNLMKGYHKNQEATDRMISKDWLHTGDLGSIDKEGYITIIGRKKELFKTSNGKYVSPIPLEQALTDGPFIDMAMIIAENRHFVSAIIVPDFENIDGLKSKLKLTHLPTAEFIKDPKYIEKIEEKISKVNQSTNHWEQIQKYYIVPRPLTIEEGDLTPKMNIRRLNVEKKYQVEIDKLYGK